MGTDLGIPPSHNKFCNPTNPQHVLALSKPTINNLGGMPGKNNLGAMSPEDGLKQLRYDKVTKTDDGVDVHLIVTTGDTYKTDNTDFKADYEALDKAGRISRDRDWLTKKMVLISLRHTMVSTTRRQCPLVPLPRVPTHSHSLSLMLMMNLLSFHSCQWHSLIWMEMWTTQGASPMRSSRRWTVKASNLSLDPLPRTRVMTRRMCVRLILQRRRSPSPVISIIRAIIRKRQQSHSSSRARARLTSLTP